MTVRDFRQNLERSFRRIPPERRGSIHDCVDLVPTPVPIPLFIKNPAFDYFKPAAESGIEHFLADWHGWPLTISFSPESPGQERTRIIIPFRGDTFGYHKSFMTDPIRKYAARDPRSFVVFPGEFIYVQPPKKRPADPFKEPIMSLCHGRSYWFGFVGVEWPLLREKRWNFLDELFPFNVGYEFISYSVGAMTRNLLLRREAKERLVNYRFANLDPVSYLNRYIETHGPAPYESRRIMRLIDIDGNIRIRDELWDLIAFIKTEIMPEKERQYYSIVSVEKDDAFPINVIMIRALSLSGVEREDGVIRYSNPEGNVIMDVLGQNRGAPYGTGDLNLMKVTAVKPFQGRVRRANLSHYDIIEFALKDR
jgi:hypothetical protein